jgi:GntR family transcriptional regulator, transcriptional repressor for pyruvate dehydrogenase complex
MFKPVARRLLASEVFDQLRDRIVRGEMEPGASLPAERVLASMLRVNRNAVREGLKRLQQAGLVAIQQGGPTRVLDFRRTAGLEMLATMVVRADGEIDTRIVRSIVELRTELAPIVGRFAARRATRQHLDQLRVVVARMHDANGDTAVLVRLALDFWAEVVEATDNIALQLAFNSLAVSYGSVLEHVHHMMADEVRATDDYEALVNAVAGRREEKAGELAKRIVARGEASVGRITKVVDSVQRAVGKRQPEPGPHPKKRSS